MGERFCITFGENNRDDVVHIDEAISTSFLELNSDDEIQPVSPIQISGTAYCSEEWVILEASVKTSVQVPCSVCNEKFEYPIIVPQWKHEEPLPKQQHTVVDVTEALREVIILEFPQFAKCAGTKCARYDTIKKYIRQSGKTSADVHRPFETLLKDFDQKNCL